MEATRGEERGGKRQHTHHHNITLSTVIDYSMKPIGGHHANARLSESRSVNNSCRATTRPRCTKVKSALLLNVVVGESATILKLLADEDEALLVRRDTFFVLDFLLDIVDGVG